MTIGISTEAPPLTAEGALTIYEAAAFKARLLSALSATPRLVVDLAAVDEFDTAGVQLLVLAQREAARTGKSIELAATSAPVDEVLQRYGLAAAFAAGASTQVAPAPAQDSRPPERSLA